jgi:hypothetical protein
VDLTPKRCLASLAPLNYGRELMSTRRKFPGVAWIALPSPPADTGLAGHPPFTAAPCSEERCFRREENRR